MNRMRSLILLMLFTAGVSIIENKAISSGAVAGATIGSIAGAALLGYGIYRIVKHERKKDSYYAQQGFITK